MAGAPHAAVQLIDAVRSMEAAGIPHPKLYVMTVLQAAKTLHAAGDVDQGRALCERAWAYTESVPELNHDREVAVHVYDAGWDHRRPRDPYYLICAYPLAVAEFGPGSNWIPYLLQQLSRYVQETAEWGRFGSLPDTELAADLRQLVLEVLEALPMALEEDSWRRRAAATRYAAQILFYAGGEEWRSALAEWQSVPVTGYDSGSELVSFLFGLQAWGPARAAAEQTMGVVETDPASTEWERASILLDLAFAIVMAPDEAGVARLPELEKRAGDLAFGAFTDQEAHVLQEKLHRYVIQRLDESDAAKESQQAMFERLRFSPFTAGSGSESNSGSGTGR